jgi:hypothetical protein
MFLKYVRSIPLSGGLLLTIHQICDRSEQASNWTWYFCGSKTIAKTIYTTDQSYYGDEALLLN